MARDVPLRAERDDEPERRDAALRVPREAPRALELPLEDEPPLPLEDEPPPLREDEPLRALPPDARLLEPRLLEAPLLDPRPLEARPLVVPDERFVPDELFLALEPDARLRLDELFVPDELFSAAGAEPLPPPEPSAPLFEDRRLDVFRGDSR